MSIGCTFISNAPLNGRFRSRTRNFTRVIGYTFFFCKQITPWHKKFKIFGSRPPETHLCWKLLFCFWVYYIYIFCFISQYLIWREKRLIGLTLKVLKRFLKSAGVQRKLAMLTQQHVKMEPKWLLLASQIFTLSTPIFKLLFFLFYTKNIQSTTLLGQKRKNSVKNSFCLHLQKKAGSRIKAGNTVNVYNEIKLSAAELDISSTESLCAQIWTERAVPHSGTQEMHSQVFLAKGIIAITCCFCKNTKPQDFVECFPHQPLGHESQT